VRAYCGDGVVDSGEVCDPGGGAELAPAACASASACATDAGMSSVPASGGCGCRAASSEGDSTRARFGLALFGLFAVCMARRRTSRRRTARRRTARAAEAG
jgi:hypothetical protein